MDVRKCLLMKMSNKYRLDFYRENNNYFDGMTFLFFDCRESNFIEQVSDIGFKELHINYKNITNNGTQSASNNDSKCKNCTLKEIAIIKELKNNP